MKRVTSYINLLTKGSRRLTVAASLLIMAGTFALVPTGAAFAATNHNVLYNANRTFGWCDNGAGNIVTISQSCAGTVWTWNAITEFAGYSAYNIESGGLCATVATGNGANYSKYNLVLVGCVSGTHQLNQQFVEPSNPGNIDSVWDGNYLNCGALNGPLVYDYNFGFMPNGGVSADGCSSGTSWYNPET